MAASRKLTVYEGDIEPTLNSMSSTRLAVPRVYRPAFTRLPHRSLFIPASA